MGQQVSVEAALGVFRQRCGELHDETLLLKARVAELEQENAQLRASAPAPAQDPYLGSAPAEQRPDGDDADLDQQNDLERGHGASLYGGVMGQPISTQ